MNTYIALFRGINVGGRNVLPMKALIELLTQLGATGISTYIQSGNVVFDSEHAKNEMSELLNQAVLNTHGFNPQVQLLSQQAYDKAIFNNPFEAQDEKDKSIHFYFLSAPPETVDHARLKALQKESESYAIVENIFYLHAPEGVGRSKLAAGAEKALGVSATARNFRTVNKIKEMLTER